LVAGTNIIDAGRKRPGTSAQPVPRCTAGHDGKLFASTRRMAHPYDRIPELAGVASYRDAARVGYSVEENVRRLLRLHWMERRLMAILIARLTSEPVWEVKCALALHQWQCAEHVEALRRRIGEMRNPLPRLDVPPEQDPTAAALDTFLDELAFADETLELLTGVYGVAYPALADAYRSHIAT